MEHIGKYFVIVNMNAEGDGWVVWLDADDKKPWYFDTAHKAKDNADLGLPNCEYIISKVVGPVENCQD